MLRRATLRSIDTENWNHASRGICGWAFVRFWLGLAGPPDLNAAMVGTRIGMDDGTCRPQPSGGDQSSFGRHQSLLARAGLLVMSAYIADLTVHAANHAGAQYHAAGDKRPPAPV